MSRLPVRPEPVPGEALHSLIERTAAANGMSPAALGLTSTALKQRVLSKDTIARLSSALDMPVAELRALTVELYPPSVLGRPYVRNWRVPGVRWICPRCTPTTGAYLRDWQLALHPLCTTCPSLLAVERAREPSTLVGAPDLRAVAAQRQIAQALAERRRGAQRGSGTRNAPLRRLYKLVTLVAATADREWPVLAGWEAELRETLDTFHTDWTRQPPNRPDQAAVVLLECWRAANSQPWQRTLIGEGWERLDESPEAEDWFADSRRSLVPARTVMGAELSDWRPDYVESYRWLMKRLARLQAETGIGPHHVPVWYPQPHEFIPARGPRAHRREELAVVLHMLLSGPQHDSAAERRSRKKLGLPGSGTITRRLTIGSGLVTSFAIELDAAADQLARAGLVDYAERRRYLKPTIGLRQALLASLSRTNVEAGQKVAPVVLMAWAWITLARSPLGDDDLTTTAVGLDRRLDPESHLILQTAALDYVEEAKAADAEGTAGEAIVRLDDLGHSA